MHTATCDYKVNHSVTILPNVSTVKIHLDILEDDLHEITETLSLSIDDPLHKQIIRGKDHTAKVHIEDNEKRK